MDPKELAAKAGEMALDVAASLEELTPGDSSADPCWLCKSAREMLAYLHYERKVISKPDLGALGDLVDLALGPEDHTRDPRDCREFRAKDLALFHKICADNLVRNSATPTAVAIASVADVAAVRYLRILTPPSDEELANADNHSINGIPEREVLDMAHSLAPCDLFERPFKYALYDAIASACAAVRATPQQDATANVSAIIAASSVADWIGSRLRAEHWAEGALERLEDRRQHVKAVIDAVDSVGVYTHSALLQHLRVTGVTVMDDTEGLTRAKDSLGWLNSLPKGETPERYRDASCLQHELAELLKSEGYHRLEQKCKGIGRDKLFDVLLLPPADSLGNEVVASCVLCAILNTLRTWHESFDLYLGSCDECNAEFQHWLRASEHFRDGCVWTDSRRMAVSLDGCPLMRVTNLRDQGDYPDGARIEVFGKEMIDHFRTCRLISKSDDFLVVMPWEEGTRTFRRVKAALVSALGLWRLRSPTNLRNVGDVARLVEELAELVSPGTRCNLEGATAEDLARIIEVLLVELRPAPTDDEVDLILAEMARQPDPNERRGEEESISEGSMMNDIIDRSVRETLEAFLNNASQFHGDTGIMHFLYHRIVTHAGDAIFKVAENGVRTLLLQSEHYTTLPYLQKGRTPTAARMDYALLDPATIRANGILSKKNIPAMVGFEVGRNKSADKMGQMTADRDQQDVKPGDAAKLIRELRFGGMKEAYLLEFYSDVDCLEDAHAVFKAVTSTCNDLEVTGLHFIVVVRSSSGNGWVSAYPDAWGDQLQSGYGPLPDPGSVKPPQPESGGHFLDRCGPCCQTFLRRLRTEFGEDCTWGSISMTVRRPRGSDGRLWVRVTNQSHPDGEELQEIDDLLTVALRNEGIEVSDDAAAVFPEQDGPGFVDRFLRALHAVLGAAH